MIKKFINRGFGLLGLLVTVGVIGIGAWLITKNLNRSVTAVDPIITDQSAIDQARQAVNQVEEKNQAETGEVNMTDWKVYSDGKLGISFSYPNNLENIKTGTGSWCKDSRYQKLVNQNDRCESVFTDFSAKNQADEMFTVYSVTNLYAQNPTPRGGFYWDTVNSIKSENSVRNLCTNFYPTQDKTCKIYKNPQGVEIAKITIKNATNDSGDILGDYSFFFLKAPKFPFLGVAFYTNSPAVTPLLDLVLQTVGFIN